ncbi:hypothetical protein Bbelb_245000 [Branchiostoma belcheri]|nr:hypothetical protein Bbelb_245000 [Branchiostoma belcheri]
MMRTLSDFLKGTKKNSIAQTASDLAKQLTKEALPVVKALGEQVMGPGSNALVGGPMGMVAGAIASAIAGGIPWDTILPSTTENPVKDLEDIRKVLRQELKEDTITQFNGLLHDLSAKLKNNYATDRKNSDLAEPSSRERLYAELDALDKRLDGVIGTLMQDAYAKVGLTSFLLLAGLRLALYQEMANVDPENKDPNFHPAKSPRYGKPRTGLVATYAKTYADHAEKLWGVILKERQDLISVTPLGKGGARVDDKLGTGTFLEEKHRSVDLVSQGYWAEQKGELEVKFGNPEEIIANWRHLINVPINIPDDISPVQPAAMNPVKFFPERAL